MSGIRQSLSRAGRYNPSALRVLTGAKVILLVVGLVGGYAVGTATDKLMMMMMMMMLLSFGGLIGYMAPQVWLRTPSRPTSGR